MLTYTYDNYIRAVRGCDRRAAEVCKSRPRENMVGVCLGWPLGPRLAGAKL